MIFEQIKDVGDNFSYIIADERTGKTAVIDPSFNSEKIINEAKKHSLKIDYIINTHQHWDHIAKNTELKSIFKSKIVAHKLSKADKDVDVIDGNIITLDSIKIKIIHTPGHSQDSICLLVDGKVLTGDTLFVGECGRTDLPGGSSKELYNSLFQKLMTLDDSIEIYPGHDYGVTSSSTIGNERKNNYTLKKRSLEDFENFMREP